MAKFSIISPMWSDVVKELIDQILAVKEGEDITLYQSTPGGSVFAGWALSGVMKEHDGEIKIKAFGDSSSMGFYNLLYADVVEALDVTKFTIHRADAWTDTDDDKKRLKSINKDLRTAMESKIDQEKFVKITGKTFDEIFDPGKRIEVTVTAKELKSLGVVNKIIRLNENEIKALSQKFSAYTDIFEEPQGDGKTQGSGKNKSVEVNKSNNNKHQNLKKMTREEFKIAHPEVYNAVFALGVTDGIAQGVTAERTRTKAFLAFKEIDLDACIKGINEGSEMNALVMAEMTAKSLASKKLEDLASNAAPGADGNKKPEAKTEAEIAEAKEIEDFTKEAEANAELIEKGVSNE